MSKVMLEFIVNRRAAVILLLLLVCGFTAVRIAWPTSDGDAANEQTAGKAPQPTEESKPLPVVKTPKQAIGIEPERIAKETQTNDLEAEFIAVLRAKYDTPKARQDAINAWRSEKGGVLDALRAAEHERLKPQREAQMAAMHEQRKQHIKQMMEAGRIGPKEGEFMTLMAEEYDSPQVRQQAIKVWNEANAAALASEREERRAGNESLHVAQTAAIREARLKQIDEQAAAGHLDPMQKQLQALMAQDYPDPLARQESLRAWMAENRADLEKETALRRASTIR